MFSIPRYEALPFMVGEHIWNFADFRTAQHYSRVVLNRKGVFNRQRAPKASAFMIRDRWNFSREIEDIRQRTASSTTPVVVGQDADA